MNISLSSILLAIFVIPFIMAYRLSPGDTPYWLFGIIFFLLFGNIFVDILNLKKKGIYRNLKYFFIWSLIVLVLGSAFVAAIIVRHKTSPTYMIHDIILQLESAIQFFLQGKNPYAVTYFGTPLEAWNYSANFVNPALYHFVMEPFYFLFSLPFYFVSITFLGFFDGRIPLYILFFILLLVAFSIPKQLEDKLSLTVLLAFNPAMLPYTLEGRSDVFMFGFFVIALYFLYIKKDFWGGIFLALAFAVKQSVWPIFPFYFMYFYFRDKSFRIVLLKLLPFAATFLLITLPFFFWNSKAFIDSTIYYLSGSTVNSYPVSGYGFGMVLHEFGFIRDLNLYYPFGIWQLSIGIPLLIFLINKLRNNLSIKMLVFCYGLFLFVFWYFSRYFNNSHLAYLSLVFTLWYFLPNHDSQNV